MDWLVSF